MSLPKPGTPRPDDASAPAESERLLEELSAILERQKASAQQGDFQSVQALAGRSDALLRELARGGPLTATSAHKLARIARAQDQLALILAAAKQGMAGQIARLRRGKAALRSYGRQ